jgi:methylthioribose-1-phosphate isomerase
MIQTLAWTGSALRLLDQTKLPTETVYVELTTEQQVHDAIRRLVVRGAPAIGVAAAFGAYLAIRNFRSDPRALIYHLSQVCDYLASARPTAVNLAWALKRIQRVALEVLDDTPSPCTKEEGGGEGAFESPIENQSEIHEEPSPHPSPGVPGEGVAQLKHRILQECLAMLEEDRRVCRAIGRHGLELLRTLRKSDATINVLTHCNAGSLATVQYGTALAPIYLGAEQGIRFHVFVDETRPLLQGSRITAYELQQAHIPCTILCDNMAATVMSGKKLDAVIVGADRIAANGDVANKIGTLGVAILARHFNIPFIVAAPMSTIDMGCASGAQIPIEQRDPREISSGFGAKTVPDGVECFNPAFDVTPAALVAAIVTERGVIKPPFDANLAEVANVPASGETK